MAYQIKITIEGSDGDDTDFGIVHSEIPMRLFVKMDGRPPSYETIKHIEQLLEMGIADLKGSFMPQIVDKLNK